MHVEDVAWKTVLGSFFMCRRRVYVTLVPVHRTPRLVNESALEPTRARQPSRFDRPFRLRVDDGYMPPLTGMTEIRTAPHHARADA